MESTAHYINDASLWKGERDGMDKLLVIDTHAIQEGYCYMHLLRFCCPLAKVEMSEFVRIVTDFKDEMGRDPEGLNVLVTLSLLMADRFDIDFMDSPDQKISKVYDLLDRSKMRLDVDEVNGKIHLSNKSVYRVGCECTNIMCDHGWSFRYIGAVIGRAGRRVGASGFNMEAFVNGELESDNGESFEDVYSQLDVPDSQIQKSRAVVETWRDGGSPSDEPVNMVDPEEIRQASILFVKRQDERNGTNLAKDLEQRKRRLDDDLADVSKQREELEKPLQKRKLFKMEQQEGRKPPAIPTPPPLPPMNKTRAGQDVRKVSDSSNHAVDSMRDKALSEMMELMISMKSENANLNRKVSELAIKQEEASVLTVRQAATPPQSPELKRVGLNRENESVGPGDSSSVFERYGNQYMPEGTVFTVRRSATEHDLRENRTLMTADNYMVEGFQQTREIKESEARSVRTLRPIHGLPKPFINTRLNFLANMHTGLGRATKDRQEDFQTCLMKAMRRSSEVPVDVLLKQVLNATIDRRDWIYTSNAFCLPYIELGMHVTEESLIKCFDLLQIEFKQVWFQEMKGITVPNFHADYRRASLEPLNVKESRFHQRPGKVAEEPRQRSRKSKSFLGL